MPIPVIARRAVKNQEGREQTFAGAKVSGKVGLEPVIRRAVR